MILLILFFFFLFSFHQTGTTALIATTGDFRILALFLFISQQTATARHATEKEMAIPNAADDVDKGVSPGGPRVLPRWRTRKRLRTASPVSKAG